MKRSIKRSLSFAAAVAIGGLAFGLFWSVQMHARTVGGGPYCDSMNNVSMCYNGSRVDNVDPTTQSTYLNSGKPNTGCNLALCTGTTGK
jgi:hypothetical protein